MGRRLILDSNLLVLLTVGLEDEDFIERHRRLGAYEPADFRLVRIFLEDYQELALCPHILTETSNLVRSCADPMRTRLSQRLASLASDTREHHVPSERAFSDPRYARLGLTDAAILLLNEGGADLLTDDLDLFVAAKKAGCAATNYAHIRQLRA
jgi:hypothetical protein